MTSAKPGAVVAVKVFMEENVVAPVPVMVEQVNPSIGRSGTRGITQKQRGQTARQFTRHFTKCQMTAGAGRKFNRESVTEIVVELLE